MPLLVKIVRLSITNNQLNENPANFLKNVDGSARKHSIVYNFVAMILVRILYRIAEQLLLILRIIFYKSMRLKNQLAVMQTTMTNISKH